MSGVRVLGVVAIVLLGAAESVLAEAHPYLPLTEGTVWKQSYSNSMVAGPGRAKFESSSKGTIEGIVGGVELRDGKEYRVVTWHFKDVPYVNGPSKSYYRSDALGVHVASEVEGKLKEVLELPHNVEPGKTWSFNDGVESTKTISTADPIKTPAGEFSDCITVVRKFKTAEANKQFTADSVFCRNIGEVRWRFLQNLNGSKSDTIKELLSYSIAK